MSAFPNLEPNHETRSETSRTGDELVVVICPFMDDDGHRFESSWDAAAEPDEVNCLFCEFLGGGWTDHGCLDSGDRAVDEP